ncbi:MAG: hypothetical protein IH865_06575 [Chloroflexi bacterium]|nr:hypothetical protein [Chloroflexota bacterium]
MDAAERTSLLTEKKEETGRTFRLWAKGQWREEPVYRVPVEALLLNVDNRRFAADKVLVESKLERSLDPENNPDDEASVIAILLDTGLDLEGNRVVGRPSKDTEALKDDWLRRRQETPFWIRPDGTVRNGNRRLALIKRLQIEGGYDGLEWIEAIILEPDDIDEDDLFRMEQREQLTENLKVRYTDINLLLALRDAANVEEIEWADDDSLEEVAGALQLAAGGDKAYAVVQLRAIRYIDAYLDDLGKPGQYHLLLRQVERFRDVGRLMAKVQGDYPDDAADMLQLAFAAIQAGNPHGDIRMLRKIFLEDREAYEELAKKIVDIEAEQEDDLPPELQNPDLSVAISEEDEEDEEPPGPSLEHYPSEKVRKEIKNAIDAFRAPDLDVRDAIRGARSRLATVQVAELQEALIGPHATEVKNAVREVVEWAEAAKEHLA